jgi:hypothetical protein
MINNEYSTTTPKEVVVCKTCIIITTNKKMEKSLLWSLCLSFLKFIYLGFLAWICSRKEEEETKKTKKNPWRKEKGQKRKENHSLVKIG